MPNSNKVYIIGFMGSGKTTTGMKLASPAWMVIYQILTGVLKSIRDDNSGNLFPSWGSMVSARWNQKCSETSGHSQTELYQQEAELPAMADNMDFMLETGLTIYLKLTPGQLKSRLSGTRMVKGL